MDLSFSSLEQETSPKPGREFTSDDDNDEYFAELRRRILLLVAEDDEEDDNVFLAPKCSAGSVDPYKGSFNLFYTPAVRSGVHLDSARHEGNVTFPTTRANPKTGTGVFIPLANPRRGVCSGRCPCSEHSFFLFSIVAEI